MLEILHTGMLVTSACGVGCSALSERRIRLATVAAGLVMLAAMVDMALGHVLLSAATWACLLVVSAVVTTSVQLHRRPGHPAMAIHRGLGAATVALLLVVDHVTSAAPPMAMSMSHPIGSGPSVSDRPVAGAVVLLYVGFSLWLAARHVRAAGPGPGTESGAVALTSPLVASRARTVLVVDVVAMTLCVVLMALLPAFG